MTKVFLKPFDICGYDKFISELNTLNFTEAPTIEEADYAVINCHGHKTNDDFSQQIELRDWSAEQIQAYLNGKGPVPIVVCKMYSPFLKFLKGELSAEELEKRAKVEASRHLALLYARQNEQLAKSLLDEEVVHYEFGKGESLRYGENSHQSATFYAERGNKESSLANAKQLHGKALSYNNIVDADAALEMIREFAGTHAVAVIKHLNPAGLATGSTLESAFEAAWQGDPVSAFGSVIACSSKVDLATAQRLKGRFVEILLAPGFDKDALSYLQKKSKDIRILEIDSIEHARPRKVLKHVIGGLLVQDRDVETYSKWETVTKTPFPANKQELAKFSWIATKHTKSNAIVMAYEYTPGYYQILGLGPGQPNRIDSNQRLCQPRVRDNVARMELPEGITLPQLEAEVFGQLVMGSDAFFPFYDSVEAAHAAGIRFIVQPGGSIRDEEVIAKADELGVAMVFTGTRHFRH